VGDRRFSRLPIRCRRFVVCVATAGMLVAIHSLALLVVNGVNREWFILAALTLLTGSFTVPIPGIQARLTVSESFVFASVLMYGPAAGTVTGVLDVLIISLRLGRFGTEPFHVVFNAAVAALSTWVASHLFFALSGVPPYAVERTPLAVLLLPLAVFTAVYFLLNSWLVTIALALERNVRPAPIWKANFLWLSLNYFGSASVAALVVAYTPTIDLTALGVIIPLLVITYLTFRTSLGRIEDARRHVDEVDRLYLSTIETLAMAIDAKDQVTHGHIRRVQQFALGLARALGVTDHNQLKALEAAALLHDTGKLVVPEHILNKPGRLTPGEFEKMKLHASAGADILSAIRFPYPVVPIVRHHHENWDGTGYPDGLKGTDIPLGARVLQVVDCFDALTSDRPYRRRLSDEEALAILMQRRGIMYDPLIVDTFATVKDSLAEATPNLETSNVTSTAVEPAAAQSVHASLIQTSGFASTARSVLQTILEATGARLAIFFVRNTSTDELNTVAAMGRDGVTRYTVEMAVGSRVSGWVAANGRAVVNADAALDISDLPTLNLAKCLSVPLNRGTETLGVLSVYLDDPRGFSDHDLVTVEAAVAVLDLTPLAKLHEQLAEITPRRQRPTVH
jgi:putative nucleotidyltransferase with HDIG domain